MYVQNGTIHSSLLLLLKQHLIFLELIKEQIKNICEIVILKHAFITISISIKDVF